MGSKQWSKEETQRRDPGVIRVDLATWWQEGDRRGRGGTEAWLRLRHSSTPLLSDSPPLLHLYPNLAYAGKGKGKNG